jgi:hypothetical protein
MNALKAADQPRIPVLMDAPVMHGPAGFLSTFAEFRRGLFRGALP